MTRSRRSGGPGRASGEGDDRPRRPPAGAEGAGAVPFPPIRLPGLRIQIGALVLLALAFYANSILGGYALDDGIVIVNNAYVQEGLSGIPKILTTDAYDSYTRHMGAGQQLSGGRYRPLSIVMFAAEHAIAGANTALPHALNVLLYALTCGLLLYLLATTLIPERPGAAFLAALLFTIHPIHTEVVANIKSRDELLSLLFILLTLLCALRYEERRSPRTLAAGLACCALALLSKEYALTMLILLPVWLWVSRGAGLRRALAATAPYAGVAALYVPLRIACVGAASVASTDILNNPFLFATGAERWATKLFVLGKYLRLLAFPWPLSCDYSYAQIPYKSFQDPLVWASIAVYAAILWTFAGCLRRRSPLAGAIALYLAPLLLVSNLLVGIGATMGERLVYHSSVGFCLALALGAAALLDRLPRPSALARTAAATTGGALIALCGAVVVWRNAVWKNDITLFTHDVLVAPNSVLVNGNAGTRYIDLASLPENKGREKELLGRALGYLDRAITLHPKFVNGYLSRGIAHFKLGDFAAAGSDWEAAGRLYPGNPYLKEYQAQLGRAWLSSGFKAASEHRMQDAITDIEAASRADPASAEIWYNLGGAYYTAGNKDKAREAWKRALTLDPAREDARRGLRALGE